MNISVQLRYRRTYYLAELTRHEKSGLLIWKINRWIAWRDPSLTLVKIESRRKMCEDYESVSYLWLPPGVREYVAYDFFPYKDGDLDSPRGPLKCLKELRSWACSYLWAANLKD